MEDVAALKAWFYSVREIELDHFLEDNTNIILRERVDAGREKVYTVSRLEQQTQCGDYWIRGFLNLPEEDQKFFYNACNCHSKIKVDEGETYECLICKKKVSVVSKPIVIMTVTDHSGTIKVVAIETMAEQILQINGAGMTSQTRQDNVYDTENIKKQINDKFFLILLRQTFGKTNESRRRRLLTAYYDETIDESKDETPTLKRKMLKETTNEGTSKKQQVTSSKDVVEDPDDTEE